MSAISQSLIGPMLGTHQNIRSQVDIVLQVDRQVDFFPGWQTCHYDKRISEQVGRQAAPCFTLLSTTYKRRAWGGEPGQRHRPWPACQSWSHPAA